jgi:excisionase family DNA binding protein
MEHEKLITAQDVAAILNVPLSSVYYYAIQGILLSLKFGRQRRFRKSEILKWLREQEKTEDYK